MRTAKNQLTSAQEIFYSIYSIISSDYETGRYKSHFSSLTKHESVEMKLTNQCIMSLKH